MLGALAGDIIGSRFEFANRKSKEFELFHPDCRFTDDSVLSVALAESLLTGEDYAGLMRRYYRNYPDAGYGGYFRRWARDPAMGPYHSFGNGSAMRTSAVGWYFDEFEAALAAAERYAAVTHNHPEGIQGAQAITAAIVFGRQGSSKAQIRAGIQERFGYDLERSLESIRPGYTFDVTCQGSVPEALIAFLEADGVEDAIRNAISLGGDADTQACMAGAVAEAYFGGVPEEIARVVFEYLDETLAAIVRSFRREVGASAE